METGLDIPTANTIIIERADRFGLAQLHQLRGRVGRSHHQAHAYLLLPYDAELNRDALRRIEAIQDAADLGAGFMLASADLDIRGAGELLGEAQSGHVQDMGLSLFSEMISEAVAQLQGRVAAARTEIGINEPTFISERYIPDPGLRLKFYRRITACASAEQLQEITAEMVDRFGGMDEKVRNLFDVAQLRIRCGALGICRWDIGSQGSEVRFAADTPVQPDKLLRLVMSDSAAYTLQLDRLIHRSESGSVQQKIQSATALVQELERCC